MDLDLSRTHSVDDVVSKLILTRSNWPTFDAIERWSLHTHHSQFSTIRFRKLQVMYRSSECVCVSVTHNCNWKITVEEEPFWRKLSAFSPLTMRRFYLYLFELWMVSIKFAIFPFLFFSFHIYINFVRLQWNSSSTHNMTFSSSSSHTRSISLDTMVRWCQWTEFMAGCCYLICSRSHITHMHADRVISARKITVVWPIMRWVERKNTSKSRDVRAQPNSFRPHSAARSKYTIWHGALNRYHHLRKFDCCIDD